MSFLAREKTQGNLITLWGDSMLPTLKEYWRVRVIDIEPQRIKIGDTVISENDTLTCHRIIGKWSDRGKIYFFQKGDNSVEPERVSADAILGKVTEVRDREFRKIEERLWKRQGIAFSLYSYLISNFYEKLLIIKRIFWRERRSNLTRFISKWYWLISFSLAQFIWAREWKIKPY